MGTLDRAIAHGDFLLACVVLEGSWGLEWRLFHVTTLAALPLSSVRTAASHSALMSAAESLLVLYLRREQSLVRDDRRTHACSFEETRGAFV